MEEPVTTLIKENIEKKREKGRIYFQKDLIKDKKKKNQSPVGLDHNKIIVQDQIKI